MDSAEAMLGHLRDPGRLFALVDAVLAVTANLSLPEVLRRIVSSAVTVVGARYGALGVLDEAGVGLAEFVHIGFDDATVQAVGRLPEGRGILGLLILEPRPIRLDNLTDHPDASGFPPGHPPMGSFLGVPIEVRGRVFGNLYLTEKTGGGSFDLDDTALAIVLARAAAVAIANARFHLREQDLSLIADRERIASDLHDRVIQRLFATGLGLQALVRAAPFGIGESIQGAVDDLDTTIREIRSTIFGLQSRGDGPRGFRLSFLQLASEAAGALGFEPTVRLDEAVTDVLAEGIGPDVLASAREALANVARHAHAKNVEIVVRLRGGVLELTVTDDGSGPGSGRRPGGRGTLNLAHRAEVHGGGFELIASPSGRGSLARWWIPVEPR